MHDYSAKMCVFFNYMEVHCFSWNTKDIKSQGRLSIDSSGHKNLKFTFGLSGSHFDSKGGVVGGNVDLQDINTHCKLGYKQFSVTNVKFLDFRTQKALL